MNSKHKYWKRHWHYKGWICQVRTVFLVILWSCPFYIVSFYYVFIEARLVANTGKGICLYKSQLASSHKSHHSFSERTHTGKITRKNIRPWRIIDCPRIADYLIPADEAVRLVKESNEIFVRILTLVIVESLYKDFTFVGVNYVSKVKKKTREMRSQP